MATIHDSNVELSAQRLLEAYKHLGAEHAQKCFFAFVEQYKLKRFEAIALRARFQELLATQ